MTALYIGDVKILYNPSVCPRLVFRKVYCDFIAIDAMIYGRFAPWTFRPQKMDDSSRGETSKWRNVLLPMLWIEQQQRTSCLAVLVLSIEAVSDAPCLPLSPQLEPSSIEHLLYDCRIRFWLCLVSSVPFCRWWTTNQRSGHLCTTAERNAGNYALIAKRQPRQRAGLLMVLCQC